MSKDAIVSKGGIMTLEYVIGIIVSFLIMGYLIYALLWPEKF
jgi:K+-transporting ATPase KdpF subunit